MADNNNDTSPAFDISIVGGGIIGLQAALGLSKRNIPVTIYEQAHELQEIGAGIGFSFNDAECMEAIDPRLAVALNEVGFRTTKGLGFVDASNSEEDLTLRSEDKLFDMHVPERGRILCQRSQFMKKLVDLLPSGCIKLGKRLDAIERDGETIVLNFTDGSKVKTDAVIGCDGIKSRVRCLLLGEDNPAAVPHYCKESAYRCLVDMTKVTPVLGKYAAGFAVWTGHGAHIISYPVAANKFLNVAAFVKDDGGSWPDYNKQTVQANKAEIKKAFSKFSPTVQGLVDTLPDEQNRWGIFDTLDYPLDTYAYGNIALAGDAAHGSTPHHGLGAGMGVEDALVLSSVLQRAAATVSDGTISNKSIALSSAFKAYDLVRRGRSQFLVYSSRRQGRLVKYDEPEIDSPEKFVKDTTERIEKIHSFDFKLAEKQSVEEYECQLKEFAKV